MKTSYSIGEFSQVTGLSVKTLRFYHEKGILIPSSVDEATGYRFHDAGKRKAARFLKKHVPSKSRSDHAVAREIIHHR